MSSPYDNGSDDTYPEDVEYRNDDSARFEAILDDDLPDYEASKRIDVTFIKSEYPLGTTDGVNYTLVPRP